MWGAENGFYKSTLKASLLDPPTIHVVVYEKAKRMIGASFAVSRQICLGPALHVGMWNQQRIAGCGFFAAHANQSSHERRQQSAGSSRFVLIAQ